MELGFEFYAGKKYPMIVVKKILSEFKAYLYFLATWFPGTLGYRLRYLVYKNRFKACGRKVEISLGSVFRGVKNISLGNNVAFGLFNQIYAEGGVIRIGDNVSFNSNVMVNADIGGEIIIENSVLIGPNVVMRASNHRYDNINAPIKGQGHNAGKIIIKEGSWIGSNVVILADVVIGKGAIVGAGAVVTKDVPDFEIAGGVPAKSIGSRI